MDLSRRELLVTATAGAGALALGPAFLREALAAPAKAGASPYGPLGAPDANGLMLPPGFSSRIVARAGQPVAGSGYVWPIFPDGQATYRTGDGGWVLVTNAESTAPAGAGASATRFRADGTIADAYRILGGTEFNCAGGPTPWGTWLSCEEVADGLVWECDPAGRLPAEPRAAMGAFKHEAVAVDPVDGRLYLTEDDNPGGFYRFTPRDYPDLSEGVLEVAQMGAKGKVRWLKVPDPTTTQTGTPTIGQVPGATYFLNGEGIWYARGILYFTTKTDKRVWAYDAERQRMHVLFDRNLAQDSSLDAVDNVTVSAVGDVLVCEDGGNMEIGLITSDREVSPLLRFEGTEHDSSEVAGAVFNPAGDRLYCTSQRAAGGGMVYEISGPFRVPKRGVPRDLIFGPPAGDARPSGPLNPGADRDDPDGRLRARRRIGRRSLARNGLAIKLRLDEAARVAAVLDTPALANEPQEDRPVPRPRRTILARARARYERDQGTVKLVLRPGGRARRALDRAGEPVRARILVSAIDGAGNERVFTRRVTIGGAR